jgi:hypothetical protein
MHLMKVHHSFFTTFAAVFEKLRGVVVCVMVV